MDNKETATIKIIAGTTDAVNDGLNCALECLHYSYFWLVNEFQFFKVNSPLRTGLKIISIRRSSHQTLHVFNNCAFECDVNTYIHSNNILRILYIFTNKESTFD